MLSRISVTTPPDRAVDAAWLNARDIGKDRLLVFDFSASDGTGGRGHLALLPYKRLPLADPGLELSVSMVQGTAAVTLKAAKPALFVTLETDVAGRFEDNGFELMAGETRVVRFVGDKGANVDALSASLRVRNLYSATYPSEQEAGKRQIHETV